jgi:predicted Zn-dependent protease
VVAATRTGWRTFVAPAAFLLAATIVVLVLRGALHGGGATATRTAPPPAAPAERAPAERAPAADSRPRLYTVRAGDTLSAIAARTGVPLARIRVLNPRLQPTALFIGQKIRLR